MIVLKKVVRKTMLYKTGVEYGDYTVNHIIGCCHGCAYPCYAYMMAHRFGNAKNLDEWCEFQICDNAVEILKKELIKSHSKIKSVQLCFSTDPFMYGHPEVAEVSIEIIKEINKYNIPCYILTKGVLPKELAELSKINYYGITYVSYKDEFKDRYEHFAAPLDERLTALKYLNEKGCKTWISIEPYPTPNIIDQDIYVLLNKISFVDRIVFGRLHYNKVVSQYKEYQKFYNECAEIVTKFCINKNIDYHIKNKTVKEIDSKKSDLD